MKSCILCVVDDICKSTFLSLSGVCVGGGGGGGLGVIVRVKNGIIFH